MKISFDASNRSSNTQMIEGDVLIRTYREDGQIISMAQFASTFQVNP